MRILPNQIMARRSIQHFLGFILTATVVSGSLRGSNERAIPVEGESFDGFRLMAEDGEYEVPEGPVLALRATFTYYEDCESYDLPFCITANNTDSPYPHLRMMLKDQVWWFEDQVTVEAKQYYRNEQLEWEVRAIVNFGHDPERNERSRIYASLVLDEPRTIVTWKEYNYYPGSNVAEDCHDSRTESLNSPQTHLVREIASVSPLLFLNTDEEAASMRAASGMKTTVQEARTGTFGVVADLSNYSDDADIEIPEETFIQVDGLSGPNYMYSEIDPVDITDEDAIWSEDFFGAVCSAAEFEWGFAVASNVGIVSRGGLDIYKIPAKEFESTSSLIDLDSMLANETIERRLKWASSTSDEWIKQLGEELTKGKPPAEWIEENNPLRHLVIVKDILGLPITAEEIQEKYESVLPDYFKATGLPNIEATISGLDQVGTALDDITGKTISLEPKLLKLYDALILLFKVESATTTVKDAMGTLMTSLNLLKFVPYIKEWIPLIQNPLQQVKTVVDTGAKPVKTAGNTLRTYDVKGKLRTTITANENIGIQISRAALTTNFVAKPTLTLFKHCKNLDQILMPMVSTVEKSKQLLDNLWPQLDLDIGNLPDFSDIFAFLKVPADVLQKVLDLFDPIIEVLDKFKAAMSHRISVSVPGPFCSVTKNVCVNLPCGVKSCTKRVFCGWRFRKWKLEKRYCNVKYPCGIKMCRSCVLVKLPKWCTKTFSFTIQQILDGISGLISIVFKPLELLMNAFLSAVNLPKLTIPGLDLNLPFSDYADKMKKALDDLQNWITFSLPKIEFPTCSNSDEVLDVTPFASSPTTGAALIGLYNQHFWCPAWDFLKPNFCEQSFDSIVCQAEQCPSS